jgi:hypothetical protein
MDVIPVIGTAIVNTPSLLRRLIHSVDYPVENFVIINNNARNEITNELDTLTKEVHSFIKKITVCHLPGNIGCAGAWNLIIKSNMMAPYWIITNPDIVYPQGFLKKMTEKSKEEKIGMVHGGAANHGFGGFEIFLIKDWVVQKIGLFDENLYPAYDEDCDYLMRIINEPFDRVLTLDMPFLHGDSYDYATGGSQTLKQDLNLKEKVNASTLINELEYMDKKWNKSWHWAKPYKHPFNNEHLPNSFTTYDLQFVRKKYVGF